MELLWAGFIRYSAGENNCCVLGQPNFVERANCRMMRTCPFCCGCDGLGAAAWLFTAWCRGPGVAERQGGAWCTPQLTHKSRSSMRSKLPSRKRLHRPQMHAARRLAMTKSRFAQKLRCQGFPPVPGSGGAACIGPVIFSLMRLFPFLLLCETEMTLGGMDLRTTAAHLRNHDMTARRPSHVPE